MSVAKGNHAQNWNDSFENLAVTYSEKLTTPAALSNFVQYLNVYEDLRAFACKNPRVVEVGCGGARSSLFLARQGIDVTCADFAIEALRLAQQNFAHFNAKGTFVHDDILNSKLEKGSFDCVMSFGLLEHFEELDPLVQGMNSLLKPGGIHIHTIIPKKFSTQVVADVLLYPFRFVKNLLAGRFEGIFVKSFRDFPHYENSYTAAEYCAAFERAGNEILRCEASGAIYPFVALPMGIGSALVRIAHKPLFRLFSRIDRSNSKFLLGISPVYYLVTRSKLLS